MQIKAKERIIVPVIIAVSVLVPVLILILMFQPSGGAFTEAPMGSFPFFHAVLNFCTALLLIMGFFAARIRNRIWHRNIMMLAFLLSTVFLVSYVISKMSNDPVPFGGEGPIKWVYYFILITHIILSAVIIPLVLFTIYRGFSGDVEKHRKIARYTMPVWLYVAITGVLVYVFMSPYY